MIYRRRPDGGRTKDLVKYAAAWEALAAPLCHAFGWKLLGFDPAYRFETLQGVPLTLPASVVRQIGSRSAYEQVLRLCDERDELRRTVARLTDEVAELRKQLTQENENP